MVKPHAMSQRGLERIFSSVQLRQQRTIRAGGQEGGGGSGKGRAESTRPSTPPTDVPPPTGTDSLEPDFEKLLECWRDASAPHGTDDVSRARAEKAKERFQRVLNEVRSAFKSWREETYSFISRHKAHVVGYEGSDSELLRQAWENLRLDRKRIIKETSPYKDILHERLTALEPALSVHVEDLRYNLIVMASHIIESITVQRLNDSCEQRAISVEQAAKDFLSKPQDAHGRAAIAIAVQRIIRALPDERKQPVALEAGRIMRNMVSAANTHSNIAILRAFEDLVPALRGDPLLLPSEKMRAEITQMYQTFLRIYSEGETREVQLLAMDVHDAFKLHFPRGYITLDETIALTECDLEDVVPMNENGAAIYSDTAHMDTGAVTSQVNGINGFFSPIPPGKVTPTK